MALIRQESIEAVLDACDMLEIVAPYTTLKKSGSNYMGRCPFHGEKTPSFSVDPVKKLYYCFGCGEGGNAFKFLEQKEGMEFVDAVKHLADKYGVKLQYEQSSPEQEKHRLAREKALSLLDQAAGYYTRVLRESDGARKAAGYLRERGFNDEIVREFRLGFSPAGGKALLKAATEKGYGKEELVYAGLVSEREGRLFDRFRGRLMFPFTDHRGRVLGFGARVLDDSKPKYLNSPDSDIYHKTDLVFGLGNARQASIKEDMIYLVEGYTDVLALRQAGLANAVACMGTALTESQFKEISRFTKNIFLALDADAAGRKAMLRAAKIAKSLDISIRVIEMPAGNDPADLVFSEGGVEKFKELAGQASALLEYQVHVAFSVADLESSVGRVKVIEELKPILTSAVNTLERDEQIRVIADRLRLRPENVAYLLESVPSTGRDKSEGETKRRVLSHEENAERIFLSLCLERPGEARRYLEDMTEAHFTTEPNRSAFVWVKERLGSAGSESAPEMSALPEDSAAHSIMPELIIRSETEQSSPEALPELYFRLCEAELLRRIKSLRDSVAEGDESSSNFQELMRLETQRRKILELIHSGCYETS